MSEQKQDWTAIRAKFLVGRRARQPEQGRPWVRNFIDVGDAMDLFDELERLAAELDRLRLVEAGAAAMREALEAAPQHHRETCEMSLPLKLIGDPSCQCLMSEFLEKRKAALATDAGRALLDDVERLRKDAAATQDQLRRREAEIIDLTAQLGQTLPMRQELDRLRAGLPRTEDDVAIVFDQSVFMVYQAEDGSQVVFDCFVREMDQECGYWVLTLRDGEGHELTGHPESIYSSRAAAEAAIAARAAAEAGAKGNANGGGK